MSQTNTRTLGCHQGRIQDFYLMGAKFFFCNPKSEEKLFKFNSIRTYFG